MSDTNSTTDKERHAAEYAALLAIFKKLLEAKDEEEAAALLASLMSMRAEHLIGYAFKGFNMTFDEALALIAKQDGLTDIEVRQRESLIAAVENMAEFAVYEEQVMVEAVQQYVEEFEESEEVDYEEFEDGILAIFQRFNYLYGWIENLDVEYAMAMAATLAPIPPTTWLMYMTMGDERVRPWHLQHEGFTATKADFPEWLIPPIEHQCRCYLIEDTVEGVMARTYERPAMPEWFNPTFKESVALGGRIFSDEHPYFSKAKKDKDALNDIVKQIKAKYLK